MQASGASISEGINRPVIDLLAAERVGNGGFSSELEIPILAQNCEGQNISNFHSVYEQFEIHKGHILNNSIDNTKCIIPF